MDSKHNTACLNNEEAWKWLIAAAAACGGRRDEWRDAYADELREERRMDERCIHFHAEKVCEKCILSSFNSKIITKLS